MTAAARSFAATWWAVRAKLGEALVMAALVWAVSLWASWPLWTVPPVWVAVQLAAMTGYAAYLTATGRPLPGESSG